MLAGPEGFGERPVIISTSSKGVKPAGRRVYSRFQREIFPASETRSPGFRTLICRLR